MRIRHALVAASIGLFAFTTPASAAAVLGPISIAFREPASDQRDPPGLASNSLGRFFLGYTKGRGAIWNFRRSHFPAEAPSTSE